MAPLVEIVFFQDWYNPTSIWGNNYIKIESFLFGFSSAGVSGVFLQVLEGQRYQRQMHSYKPELTHEALGFWGGLIIFYGVWWLGTHSFYAALASCSFMVACFAVRRPDLLGLMARTATMAPLIAIPGYWVMLLVSPHFFAEQWFLHNLSGQWILGLPLEELLWFSYSSAMFAGAWKVHTATQICPIKRKTTGFPALGYYPNL